MECARVSQINNLVTYREEKDIVYLFLRANTFDISFKSIGEVTGIYQ